MTTKHTPAEAQSELSARLGAVITHLVAQQTSNAPVTPWVLDELRDVAAAIANYEPPRSQKPKTK